MKRININTSTGQARPFWLPWGIWGTAWRGLVFLAALLLFLWLLLWLMNLGEANRVVEPDDDVFYESPEPWTPEETTDSLFIRDVEPDRIIVDPDNPYRQIVEDKLNIIVNEKSDGQFEHFLEELKGAYPEEKVKVEFADPMSNTIQIIVPPAERSSIKADIPQKINDVEVYIFEEEILAGAAKTHNDPAFKNEKQSWQFAPIQAPEAWDITQGDPEITVAVIDSYFDTEHPELKGRVVKPYSVERRNGNVLPPSGKFSPDDPATAPLFHGTHVAAIAVGAIDNGAGSAGIAPKASLMPVSLGAQMTSMKLLQGLLYAINNGADVVNISIASFFPPGAENIPVEEQIKYIKSINKDQEDVWDYAFKMADERNVVIVWAAGNCNVITGLDETKRNPSTIRVSAVDQKLRKADFSNYGYNSDSQLFFADICAPGADIYSAVPGNKYTYIPGTSMAAPMVTGAVALMKSINPKLTNKQVIDILKKTSKKLKDSDQIGGLLQIRDALRMVKGDFANFDEIMKDPKQLIGTWETTEMREVTDAQTGEPTGSMTHIFIRFDSPERGSISYKEDTGHTYTAPFKAKIKDNKLYINQPEKASSKTGPGFFVPNEIICERGKDGTLIARNKNSSETFYLMPVKR